VVADGHRGGVGFEERADDVAHLGLERGVPGVVERLALLVGESGRFRVADDEASGHPAGGPVARVHSVGVVGPDHRDEGVVALDRAAEVHPHPADGLVVAELVAAVLYDFGRGDQFRALVAVHVADVVGVAVGQQEVIGV
jgi:hypothetical protein